MYIVSKIPHGSRQFQDASGSSDIKIDAILIPKGTSGCIIHTSIHAYTYRCIHRDYVRRMINIQMSHYVPSTMLTLGAPTLDSNHALRPLKNTTGPYILFKNNYISLPGHGAPCKGGESSRATSGRKRKSAHRAPNKSEVRHRSPLFFFFPSPASSVARRKRAIYPVTRSSTG